MIARTRSVENSLDHSYPWIPVPWSTILTVQTVHFEAFVRYWIVILSAAVDILHLFPELTAIGRKDLQVYCDEWLRRPIAREFGIAQITVDERLMLELNLAVDRAGFVGDSEFIPIDELLGYVRSAIGSSS